MKLISCNLKQYNIIKFNTALKLFLWWFKEKKRLKRLWNSSNILKGVWVWSSRIDKIWFTFQDDMKSELLQNQETFYLDESNIDGDKDIFIKEGCRGRCHGIFPNLWNRTKLWSALFILESQNILTDNLRWTRKPGKVVKTESFERGNPESYI